MKTSAVILLAALGFAGCNTRQQPATVTPASPAMRAPTIQGTPPTTATVPMLDPTGTKTFSSFDRVPNVRREIPAGGIIFQDADARQVFELYQELSGRSIIYSARVPKNVKITFRNSTPLTRVEALQAMDTVLAAQGIVMVYSGEQYVKACGAADAPTEVPPLLTVPWRELPDSGSYVSYQMGLKNMDVREAVASAQPFAKLPNSIIADVRSNSVTFRDLSSNVRRMVEILERLDQAGQAPK